MGTLSKVSVVVNTLNEERNISKCLESVVGFADEVLVVDMYSVDRTIELADRLGARILHCERTDRFNRAKRYGIENAGFDWVMMMDADERMKPSLARCLCEVATSDRYVGVRMARQNYFLGRWIHGGGFWPAYQTKFFNRNSVVWGWEEELHGQPALLGETKILPADEPVALVHQNYVSIEQFVERTVNRYTTILAQQLCERGGRFRARRMLVEPVRDFLARYVRRRGYRDGMEGFILCVLLALHEFVIYAKLWELERKTRGLPGD